MRRRFPIFQFPNPPLLATMAAAAIARMTRGKASRAAMQLARLGLLWWSAEEIMSGANWFRRLLGAAAGAYSLATSSSSPSWGASEHVYRHIHPIPAQRPRTHAGVPMDTFRRWDCFYAARDGVGPRREVVDHRRVRGTDQKGE